MILAYSLTRQSFWFRSLDWFTHASAAAAETHERGTVLSGGSTVDGRYVIDGRFNRWVWSAIFQNLPTELIWTARNYIGTWGKAFSEVGLNARPNEGNRDLWAIYRWDVAGPMVVVVAWFVTGNLFFLEPRKYLPLENLNFVVAILNFKRWNIAYICHFDCKMRFANRLIKLLHFELLPYGSEWQWEKFEKIEWTSFFVHLRFLKLHRLDRYIGEILCAVSGTHAVP